MPHKIADSIYGVGKRHGQSAARDKQIEVAKENMKLYLDELEANRPLWEWYNSNPCELMPRIIMPRVYEDYRLKYIHVFYDSVHAPAWYKVDAALWHYIVSINREYITRWRPKVENYEAYFEKHFHNRKKGSKWVSYNPENIYRK